MLIIEKIEPKRLILSTFFTEYFRIAAGPSRVGTGVHPMSAALPKRASISCPSRRRGGTGINRHRGKKKYNKNRR